MNKTGHEAYGMVIALLAGFVSIATVTFLLSQNSSTVSFINTIGGLFKGLLATIVSPVKQASSPGAVVSDTTVYGGAGTMASGTSPAGQSAGALAGVTSALTGGTSLVKSGQALTNAFTPAASSALSDAEDTF